MKEYVVKKGDSLSSIGARYGLKWEDIYYDDANKDFRGIRDNADLIYPGDVVFIPEKKSSVESKPTNKKHSFTKKIGLDKLHLKFLDANGEPLKNIEYTLSIKDKDTSEVTSSQGELVESLPQQREQGRLVLKTNPEQEYVLNLDDLDPIEEESGVRERLYNLGYFFQITREDIEKFDQAAILKFQEDHKLSEQSGKVDSETRKKLKDVYGC